MFSIITLSTSFPGLSLLVSGAPFSREQLLICVSIIFILNIEITNVTRELWEGKLRLAQYRDGTWAVSGDGPPI